MNGKKLRELREAKGITAAGLDEYLGVPRGTCVSWENGFSEPEEELIEDLAGYFRVSVKELVQPKEKKETGEENKTMAAKRKFTDEQRDEILKRAEETSVAAAAREFGVSRATIINWKNAAEEGATAEKPKKTTRKTKAEKTATEAAAEAAPKKATRKPKAEAAAEEKPKKTTRKPNAEKTEAATEEKPKRTTRKPKAEKPVAEKATTEAAPKNTTRKPKAEAAAEAAPKKTTRKPKAEATTETAPKKTTRKPKVEAAPKTAVEKKPAAEMQIFLQSPFNHEITPDGILAKIPEGTEKVYVRIDQNKIYWVKGEETGDVDIW